MTRVMLFLIVFSSLVDILSASPKPAGIFGDGNFPGQHTLVPPYFKAPPTNLPVQQKFPSSTITPSRETAPSSTTAASLMNASSVTLAVIPGVANLPGPLQIPMPPSVPLLPIHKKPQVSPQKIASHDETKTHLKTTSSVTTAPSPMTSSSNGAATSPRTTTPSRISLPGRVTSSFRKTTRRRITERMTTSSTKTTASTRMKQRNLERFVKALEAKCDFDLLDEVYEDLRGLWADAMKAVSFREFMLPTVMTTVREVNEIQPIKSVASSEIEDLQAFLKYLVEQYNNCAEKWLILDLDRQWEIYWKIFGKEYTEKEKETRKAIFKRNMDEVIKHNELCKKSLVTYSAGLNHFSDWTEEELEELNGFQPSNATVNSRTKRTNHSLEGATKMVYDYNPNDTLPDSFVWSKDHVTAVKHQGDCGACYAFAGIGALEAYQKKKTGKLIELSVQNILDCTWHLGNKGCIRGRHSRVFDYARTDGVVANSWYPYTMNASHDCRWKREHVAATDRGFYRIPKRSENALQHAVANLGPVAVAIGTKGIHRYRSGVFRTSDCGPASHSVLVVGYGIDPWAGDYWIMKNCWGPTWGDDGYMRMARNKDNMCHIASYASLPY